MIDFSRGYRLKNREIVMNKIEKKPIDGQIVLWLALTAMLLYVLLKGKSNK